jgi:hypothetical protein
LNDQEAICEEVPLEVSGTFLADNNGNWEGDKEFEYSKAIYSFTFNRLESSESAFADIIDIALDRMGALSELMKRNNLVITILFWTTWEIVSSAEEHDPVEDATFVNDDKTHYFSLTGL